MTKSNDPKKQVVVVSFQLRRPTREEIRQFWQRKVQRKAEPVEADTVVIEESELLADVPAREPEPVEEPVEDITNVFMPVVSLRGKKRVQQQRPQVEWRSHPFFSEHVRSANDLLLVLWAKGIEILDEDLPSDDAVVGMKPWSLYHYINNRRKDALPTLAEIMDMPASTDVDWFEVLDDLGVVSSIDVNDEPEIDPLEDTRPREVLRIEIEEENLSNYPAWDDEDDFELVDDDGDLFTNLTSQDEHEEDITDDDFLPDVERFNRQAFNRHLPVILGISALVLLCSCVWAVTLGLWVVNSSRQSVTATPVPSAILTQTPVILPTNTVAPTTQLDLAVTQTLPPLPEYYNEPTAEVTAELTIEVTAEATIALPTATIPVCETQEAGGVTFNTCTTQVEITPTPLG